MHYPHIVHLEKSIFDGPGVRVLGIGPEIWFKQSIVEPPYSVIDMDINRIPGVGGLKVNIGGQLTDI
jgi:hypothetical protein